MKAKLEMTGDLWLYCQEGGIAADAFCFHQLSKQQKDTQASFVTISLDDLVAEHFGAERIMPSGNRHIGMVRITIEQIDESDPY